MDFDSRLIKIAIAVSLLVTLAILAVVLALNWQQLAARYGFASPTPAINEEVWTEEESTSGLLVGSDPQAFLRDRDFFDDDGAETAGITVTYGKTAELVLSSVEKDLRVHIVDILGRHISGEEWSVLINGVEYRDDDRDGIIYIRPIEAGEHEVLLNPKAGYRTAAEASLIRVKNQIEYVAISERDLKILSESQIDASIEDVSEKMADEDRDGSEFTEPLGSWGGAKLGIDVSKWNKEIDWQRVKAAGVEFAIIRVGYRGWTTGALVEDPYFAQNIREASEAGIAVGIYFFTQAVNALEAVEEASMALALVEDYRLDYPIFIDSEGTGTAGQGRADHLSVDVRTEVCLAFMETVRNAGYNAGLYAARHWLYNQLDTTRLSRHIIWLAEYRDVPLYTGYYQLWQYSSRGQIDGIEGNVDLNLSYLD